VPEQLVQSASHRKVSIVPQGRGIKLFKSSENNKNTQTLTDASKEVGLEVNVEKTRYMLVSRDQNARQNREIKIGNRSFENVSQFKYLGMTVTNQNFVLSPAVKKYEGREEHKLRVFENRVLRRIFGPKRDGVTG
jgi:hypothetical protein